MAKGKVYLVGAGPGRPDLITIRGLNVLKLAEVVIYDYLVDKRLLKFADPGAELICADRLGKKRYADTFLFSQEKINQLMIKKLRQGRKVVRLKNGDPLIFGRLSQEVEALLKHKVEFEIVPGVTAASAASAYTGIPLTDRRYASSVINEVEEARKLGIRAVLLFGLPRRKDLFGSEASRSDGIVQRAVSALKKRFNDLTVMTDVCLCAYTSHGHCAILKSDRKVDIDLRATLEVLAKIALSHAEAGADIVAPSAMMKGQVKAIRKALNENGFKKVKIMGYSAKFASSFYGPFREALDSAPAFGDRRGYQLDYRSAAGALKEIEADIKEGADIVMVKPALAYLDIIYQAKQKFKVPMAAYNVSGEYAIIRNQGMVLEVLTAIKRAGADVIITYHAKEIAKII